MPFGLQPWHLLLALVAIVLVMGPKRLPEIGQALGKTIRGFKDELDAEPSDDAITRAAPSISAATAVDPAASALPATTVVPPTDSTPTSSPPA